MEFATIEGAVRSKTKNDTMLLGRAISVQQKRKNLPKPKNYFNNKQPQFIGGANPLMMQACAMMMAACSGGSGRGMPFYRGRGRGSGPAFRGRGQR